MNSKILASDVQEFINENLNTDIHKILLSKSKFPEVSSRELVEQIESKLKAKSKLPTWFATDHIYYPNKLNLSQTSSETTADYKSTLVNGNTIVDLTAGFGVDSLAFSKKMNHVIHLDKNEELSKIAHHNFKQLNAVNIECIAVDGLEFLRKTNSPFDWIYIDPSRRDKDNKKVYYLSDCEPNVVSNINLLLSKTSNLLIKTGPLLDLKSGLKELLHVKEIHIVAINNEVKEILWSIEKGYKDEPLIKTVNVKAYTTQKFYFQLSDEENALILYSGPLTYIYEPNASILKSGAFKVLAQHYKLFKIHPNSHLYTSKELIPFPGRIFKVQNIYDYSNKIFKKSGISKANITTRNFPDSVEKIRKKLSIKDGGKNYLFCTTDLNEKLIIISSFQIFYDQ
ncbi:class I SAM-dependent methyltransferase [Maribacter sp. 1_MG-2023]|uniref:class I SAM-dependent methyltransferase n=1 Tax=Maribacter sp. 1_MG-2023 TaxID=3062677 RepID=UPI0026E33AA4|nr:class I SAM-dependent methyltransferase [Maribacter sp. 1_MG-2023]MDO6472213.1 RsmD family RNA methyltransferase [Maribacter sp. 1_MG-2023]